MMGVAVAVDPLKAAAERAKMTPALRRQILFRDEHRCKLCGVDVASGGALHVDHIVPIARGGETEAENLRVLCSACNTAKASKLDHEDIEPPKRKSPVQKKTCRSCAAYHETESGGRYSKGEGHCRMRAPVMIQWMEDREACGETRWPTVQEDSYCLEHTGLDRNKAGGI